MIEQLTLRYVINNWETAKSILKPYIDEHINKDPDQVDDEKLDILAEGLPAMLSQDIPEHPSLSISCHQELMELLSITDNDPKQISCEIVSLLIISTMQDLDLNMLTANQIELVEQTMNCKDINTFYKMYRLIVPIMYDNMSSCLTSIGNAANEIEKMMDSLLNHVTTN